MGRTEPDKKIWTQSAHLHKGQRSEVPRRKAGHMTAPDLLFQMIAKALVARGIHT